MTQKKNPPVKGRWYHDNSQLTTRDSLISSPADTKSQGVNPSTTAIISLADLLENVKNTHHCKDKTGAGGLATRQ